MKKIAIFVSGKGSNMVAIIKAVSTKLLQASVVLIVSDNPKCLAIEKAENLGIPTLSFNPKEYKHKILYEKEILKKLKATDVDLIVLAGYMRLIGETLLMEYKDRIINIHPSYLPNFRGKDAIGQALIARAKYTGVTVHYVDEGIDTGRIIEQEKIEILVEDNRETLEKKVHEVEHRIYPKVIKKVLEEL
jgi:phosphoribosylglycinamide formyltransferase 1